MHKSNREVTNFRGTGRTSRSTTPSYHDESKLKTGNRPDVSAGNGSKVQAVKPKSSESKKAQRTGDYDS